MTSWVYFLRAGADGPVKIGYTKRDPRKRMADLQTGCPWPVTLLGAVPGTHEDEKRLQAPHERYRLREDWFHPYESVLTAIEELLNSPDAWRQPVEPKHDHPISRYRAEHALTLEELAAQLGMSGVALSRYETGKRKPHPNVLQKIARVTGIPPRLLRPDIWQLLYGSPQ